MKLNTYGYEALGGWNDQAERSSDVVVPLVLDLVKPRSVVDVGCGPGLWLEAYERNGIKDFLGIDGPWVRPETLKIAQEKFRVEDLSQPLKLGRRFDLVNSLEVAEHLDGSKADTFVDTLCSLGDVIMFSAAIPGQRGYHHVNEQFQDYWVSRFRARGFECYDFFRPRIWNDPKVSFFYKQNVFLYARAGHPLIPRLRELERLAPPIISLVHPELYLRRLHPIRHIMMRVMQLFGRK